MYDQNRPAVGSVWMDKTTGEVSAVLSDEGNPLVVTATILSKNLTVSYTLEGFYKTLELAIVIPVGSSYLPDVPDVESVTDVEESATSGCYHVTNNYYFAAPKDEVMSNSHSPGAAAITAERLRQISVEGWTPEHDDHHSAGDMLDAARCYLLAADATRYGPRCVTFNGGYRPGEGVPQDWPWDAASWRPSGDALRDLERAGALIAAEFDRIKRVGPILQAPEAE